MQIMNKIKVGKIINTHGIKGELKISKTGVESFDRDIPYYIGNDNIEYSIEKVRKHKDNVMITLKGFNNINKVLKFKDKDIFINEGDMIGLDDDEYYINELIDMEVYNQDNHKIGVIKDVLKYDVNDIYIVKSKDHEIMIPAVKEFILSVDLDNRKIVVKLIEGM
ncbi:16S rRNA processing protein RimM [Helcococcus ovis]|nr:16S rRNA processing protein RimM [Helcococcus ovis]